MQELQQQISSLQTQIDDAKAELESAQLQVNYLSSVVSDLQLEIAFLSDLDDQFSLSSIASEIESAVDEVHSAIVSALDALDWRS